MSDLITKYYKKLVGKSFEGIYEGPFEMDKTWDKVKSLEVDEELDKDLEDILEEFGDHNSGNEKIWKGFHQSGSSYMFYAQIETENLEDLIGEEVEYKIKKFEIFGGDSWWKKAYKYEMKKGVEITLEPK